MTSIDSEPSSDSSGAPDRAGAGKVAGDRIGSGARAVFFALLPAASAGGGLALAPLIAGAGAASLRPSLLRADLFRPSPWLVLLLLFAIWMSLSALWSPFGSAIQALKFWLTMSLGLMFVRAAAAGPRLTLSAATAALIVLGALLAVEALLGMPLNHAANPGMLDWQLAGNPGRGTAVLTALIWGVLGWMAAKRAWALVLIALIGGAVLAAQFGQSANIAAFAIGTVAFVLGYAAPRLAVWAVGGALALWLVIAPFVTPLLIAAMSGAGLPYSWAARLEIWRYVSARILESPWIGHGLDASRVDAGEIVVQGVSSGAIPLHPHSASLQIWFETGAVGALLGAAGLLAGAWALARTLGGRQARASAAAACGALAAIGVIANLSFGVWQEWWNAAMLIAAAPVAALAACRPKGRG